MKNLLWIKSVLVAFVLLVSVSFLISCAGTTQSGPYADDDLYPGEETTDEETTTTSDEEEVLRLLGLADEEEETPAAETTTSAPQTGAETSNLSEELERLEQEVNEKERQVTNLQQELQEKEQLIESKEQSLERMQTTPQTTGYVASAGTSFKSRYDQALALYNSRRYREAIAAFDQLLATGQNNSLIDNCQYWKGECYYGLGNYNQAVLEFQKVFTYPTSNKLDDAQLKLGLCYMRLGNNERAKREFDKLLAEYPDSEYAGRARSFLNQL